VSARHAKELRRNFSGITQVHRQMIDHLDVEFTCLAPTAVDGVSAASFRQLVLAAGEVNPNTLPALYDNALALAFARVDGEIVGIGALKRPLTSYRDKVFERAKSRLAPESFEFELGWFHVLGKFEGNRISSRMVERLMPWAEGTSVYATSRINNSAMHAALTRHGGFKPEGSEYRSSQGDVPIRLFVRRSIMKS
jgi:hypothetical protein